MVAAAHLEFAVLCLVKVQEVITLEQLISKLGERQSVAGLAVQTTLHAVFRHHIVHCDMLAHLAREVEEREFLHPVIVVDQLGCVGSVAVEIQEFRQLLLDAVLVVTKHFLCQQIALCRLSRRVADHTCCSADKRQRLVAATLEVAQNHYAHQMSDVQRVCRWVDADIGSSHFFLQLLFCARHHVVHHTAPF